MFAGFLPVGAQAALVDASDYITQQLYLGDNLTLYLRGYVDSPYAKNAVATVTYADQVDTYRVEDLTVSEDGLYEIAVDLAAGQMTEAVNLKIQVGSLVILEETYSIRSYLEALLEGSYTRETKELVQELLNYGAWTQKYFDYQVDDLANTYYAVDAKYAIPSEAPTVEQQGSVSGIGFYGVSVVFLSKTAVRFYFSAPDGVDGYTFTVDGEEYTPVSKDELYYIEVSGINPQDMETEMTVAVTDGSSTLSFGYAPTYFFIRSYHKAADETYKGLLEAAYSYFTAAKVFDSVTNTGKLNLFCQSGSSNTLQVSTDLPSDTALADFALNENGCSVNESANQYQTASSVGMTKENGVVILNFNFDDDFEAGQTYCLQKNSVFCFTDNSQYVLTRDYIFLYDGTFWTSAEAEGDFIEGVDFETTGNALLFTGQGHARNYATVAGVSYDSLAISAPVDGGSYALKLSHESSQTPGFRISFGRELAARTKISFLAYGNVQGASLNDQSVFEFSAGGEATDGFACGQWTELTVILPENAEYLDLLWNYGRANITSENISAEVYIDNVVAVEPVEAENVLLGFESYEEITGAKIAVGNMLGKMTVNSDVKYISQGSASMKVEPQGDYSKPGEHPYFKLDFLDSTCLTGDFSAFKNVSFDVYNAESENLCVRTSLVVGEDSDHYQTTAKKTVTLAPNSWTTCIYDLSLLAGYDIYDFSNVRYLIIEFLEHKESRDDVPHVLYIDNLIGNTYAEGEIPGAATYDFHTGINFEEIGNELLFTGQGIEGRDAEIERVTYDDLGVAAPTDGGSYALKLSHLSNYWPTFRIHFGEEMPEGTQITFWAYGKIYGQSLYNQSVFEYSDGGEATEQFKCDRWVKLTMTLPYDTEYIDLYWNYDRANIQSATAAGEVYIDNVQAVEPVVIPEGDFQDGVDFETRGNTALITGQGNTATDGEIKRVPYTKLGIDGPAGGGAYALKVSHTNNSKPTFRVNFGEELAAGTVISFWAYGKINSVNILNRSTFKFANGSTATGNLKSNTWTQLHFTLPANASYVDLIWDFSGAWILSSTASGEVYLDNIKAVEPAATAEGDFTEGIDFEIRGHAARFTGQGNADSDASIRRVAYSNTDIPAPTDGGSYALRLTHASNYWPTFRISFGKELAAGTQITFMAYGKIYGQSLYNQSIFEYSAGGEATEQFKCDRWVKLTITLPAAAEYIDLYWNIDRAQITSQGAYGELYIDNVLAVEPVAPAGDFTEGIGFEEKGNEARFEGQGIVNRDAIIEKVSYDSIDISAPTNGGSYALKLSHESNYWPTFRINFGKELAAGTEITFMAYGRITSGTNRYNQSIFEFMTGGEATAQFKCNQWTELTITLPATAEYIDLFWNYDRAGITSGTASGEVYLDNFIAAEPVDEFLEGIDFEAKEDTLFFVGQGAWNDAAIERVTYTDAGITAPTDGGSYALKLSHASNYWPTFRINFGRTLPAGTQITFMAYGQITSGTNRYNQSIFEFTGGGEATEQFKCDQWTELTITLPSDAEYINLFWNFDRASITSSTASGEVYIDNVIAVVPADT